MADRRTIYRITHERYADDPFSGKGGLQYRSRWASKGQLVSYASAHLATAILEKIAGVHRADLLTEMVYVKAEVEPNHVEVLPNEELPADWDALPPNSAPREVGDRVLSGREGCHRPGKGGEKRHSVSEGRLGWERPELDPGVGCRP